MEMPSFVRQEKPPYFFPSELVAMVLYLVTFIPFSTSSPITVSSKSHCDISLSLGLPCPILCSMYIFSDGISCHMTFVSLRKIRMGFSALAPPCISWRSFVGVT